MNFQKMFVFGIISILIFGGLTVSSDLGEGNQDNMFAGGSGTSSNPYQIGNVTHLQNMQYYPNAWYELVNDIDASETRDWNGGRGFEPIGTRQDQFKGKLDGNGYDIKELYIDRPDSQYVGLFGYINREGNVTDLGITSADISGKEMVGALVGFNHGCIESSFATGSVNGDIKVGGLVGVNFEDMDDCYANADVSGVNKVGVLAGQNDGIIMDSNSSGSVSGDEMVGGLVGFNWRGKVNNSHYSYEEVMINGGNQLTVGALYEGQYKDWIYDKRLDIEDYSDTLSHEDDHYEINGPEGIRDMLGFAWKEQYRFELADDIDLSSYHGLYIPYLAADFDGDEHEITGLQLNSSSTAYLGLFGYVNGGRINNLALTDIHVNGEVYTGGICGYIWDGTVEDSNVTGEVRGNYTVGGVVGHNQGTVDNCKADTAVHGHRAVGGMVGYLNYGTVNDSYALGQVSGYDGVGGLVGNNWDGLVNNSRAECHVEGQRNVGGLMGRMKRGNRWGTVRNSYSTGTVEGSSYVGGLVGDNARLVKNCYAAADVSGIEDVGGLVGDHTGKIINCYSLSPVDGNYYVGGLVGNNNNGYDVIDSFWDVNRSGISTSDGGTGKTSEEMKDIDTYTDNTTVGLKEPWDFLGDFNDDSGDKDIWYYDKDGQINDGYPFLKGKTGLDEQSPHAVIWNDKDVLDVGEELSLNGSESHDNIGIVDYSWDLGNGENKYGKEVTCSYTGRGTYEIQLNVTDPAGNFHVKKLTVEVREDETPPTADAGEDIEVSVGEEIRLDASGSYDNGEIVSYEWDLGNGETKEGKVIDHTYGEEGNYTVELTVTDREGNTDKDTINVVVEEDEEPTTGFTIPVLLVCVLLAVLYHRRKFG